MIRVGLVLLVGLAVALAGYPQYDQSYFPPSPSRHNYGRYSPQRQYDSYDDDDVQSDIEDRGREDRFRERGRYNQPRYYDQDRFQMRDYSEGGPSPSPPSPSSPSSGSAPSPAPGSPPSTPDSAQAPPVPPPPPPPGAADEDTRPCAKTSDGCIAAELHSDLSQLNTDPEQAKLDGQLEDTEADIVSRKRSIKNEKNWISQVELILKNYAGKVEKVKAHMDTEKKALTDLKTKKKKIQNLIKKKQLELELRTTTEDLNELQNELKQVTDRESEFNKSKDDLKEKINELETQISSLKGDEGGNSSTGPAAGGDDGGDDTDDAAASSGPAAGASGPKK